MYKILQKLKEEEQKVANLHPTHPSPAILASEARDVATDPFGGDDVAVYSESFNKLGMTMELHFCSPVIVDAPVLILGRGP